MHGRTYVEKDIGLDLYRKKYFSFLIELWL